MSKVAINFDMASGRVLALLDEYNAQKSELVDMGADSDVYGGFAGRLRELLGTDSVLAFAKKCETPESVVRKYLKGTLPNIERAQRIADVNGVRIEWLASGRGPKYVIETVEGLSETARGELVLIPSYEVRAGAGNGGYAISESPKGFIAFQEDWVRQTLHCSPSDLAIVESEGDSMEPTISGGDPLIVNRSDTELKSGCVYVFRIDDTIQVKRIQRRVSGEVVLMSDNPSYPSETLTKAEVGGIHIIGRLLFPVHRL